MGAWGVLAFDNDTANDWAYDLEDVDDLSLVESALEEVEASEGDYLESDLASQALAACEVLARLQGRPGYTNAYTEKVDAWVASHPQVPSAELLARASTVMDRILGEDSELRELWEEGEGDQWRASVEELRQRLLG
ncbi:MAG: DUF4259 domain-containing protein [Isosphaeraceae bacterium]